MQKSLLIFKILFLAILIGFGNYSVAQINSTGIPIVQSYTHKEYAASEVNWSITQDHRGVMYFGNSSDWILEYDGQTWNKINVPNQQFILSLTTGPDGKIYVGGTDDFGHLISDSKGQLVYESLKSLLSNTSPIPRVWKVYSTSESVFFCTLQRIFIYNPLNKTISDIPLPDNSFWSFLVNDTLYIGNYNTGLHYIINDELVLVNGGKNFVSKDIFAILPWSDNVLLIATTENGLCLLNTQTGEVDQFNFSKAAINTNQILFENSIYSGVTIDDSHFAFGTRLNGVFIINKSGEIVNHLNPQLGLQSETATSLFFSPASSGVLWVTQTNGIASVNITSPIRFFSEESGLNGTIYGVAKHNNSYYAGTMYGVFKLTSQLNASSIFTQVEGISGEVVYSLINFVTPSGKDRLLAASEREVYEVKGDKAMPLNVRAEVFRLVQSSTNPSRIYVGTSRGIRYINYQNNRFIPSNEVFALNDIPITNITEDNNGNLWCSTLAGIQLVSKTGNTEELPQSIQGKNGVFFNFGGDIFFTSRDTVFIYNYSSNSFTSFKPLNLIFLSKGKKLREVFPLNDSMAVAFYEQQNSSRADFLKKNNGNWSTDTTSLRLIPSMTIQTAFQDYNLTFVGGQEGLFIHNNLFKKNFNQKFNTIIRSIVIGSDSVVYKGADGFFNQVTDQTQTVNLFHSPIRFRDNNIIFNFSSPYFEVENEVVYKWFLEGNDRNWSRWEKTELRNYTNLSEGTYRFHVKAKNIYGVESDMAIFEFKILPPWYRTWWAYIIYVILALVIIWLSIAWYTRKLQEDKRRLEAIVKERTAEIVEKNKKIEHQNIAITDSIRYAKRIQTAVLPDKQTCSLFDYFIYFIPKDIVSGDFYWVHHFEKQKRLIVIAADCTGHGVPGAFMSMLGTSFLNEIVAKLDVNHSDSILNLLRQYVINTLSQGLKVGDKDERKDGMDMALVSIDLSTMMLEFSGANNPLVLIRNGELLEYKPDKMPIGAYVKQDIPFQRTDIQLLPGDIFYLFSDGYVDQFGGTDGRKFMKKNFKELLVSIHQLPMEEQKEILRLKMEKWMEGHEQIDDQIVIGMKASF